MTRADLYEVKNYLNKILTIVLQVAIHTKQFSFVVLPLIDNSIVDMRLWSSDFTGLQFSL